MKSIAIVSVLGGTLLGSYCSTRREPESRAANVPSVPASSSPQPKSAPLDASSPTEVAEERYAPLLLQPGFEAVVQALDDRDDGRAATLVAERLAAAPPPPADATSFAYLSARLFERAGRMDQALAAYERAVKPSYVLSDYARAGRARSLIALGRAAEALAEVHRIADDPVLAPTRRTLLGEAAYRSGNRDAALVAWRTTISDALAPVERWTASLKLAAALLEPPDPDAGTAAVAKEAALEALNLAQRVAAEAAATDDVARRAGELVERALAALPEAERTRHALPSVADEIVRVKSLVDGRRFEQALGVVAAVRPRLTPSLQATELGCELELSRAKAEAGERAWAQARSAAAEAAKRCKSDADRHARALFLGAKYAMSEKNYLAAAGLYEKLEQEHPKNSLAD
ncbi:MAG TPA: hypothetical protein VFZ53_20620, partial [Polyangiaceae bacterium]